MACDKEEISLLQLLHVTLIADKLLDYLSFEDIKCLSIVSCEYLTVIRKSTLFEKKAMLKTFKEIRMTDDEFPELDHYKILKIPLDVLQYSTYSWKNISLSLSDPICIMAAIYDSKILENATFLSLTPSRSETGTWSKIEDDDRMVHLLSAIFKKTGNLRELRFGYDVLLAKLDGLFAIDDVQRIFSKLQVLDITGTRFDIGFTDADIESNRETFQHNILLIFKMSLKVQRFALRMEKSDFPSKTLLVFDHINYILVPVKNTLEELHLDPHSWIFNLDEIKNIHFPCLKRLTFTTMEEKRENSNVFEMISNQPPLEELCIGGHLPCVINLLNSLHGGGKLGYMVRLKIIFGKPAPEPLEPVDWDFLESMYQLKEFTLVSKRGANIDKISGSGEAIIQKLPASAQKIKLHYLDVFWHSPQPQRDIGRLLQRFKNLSELVLYRCPDAVNDEGLQNLIRKCGKLTILKIFDCPQLTDFGISGIRENPEGDMLENSGASLANLKGLTLLGISHCLSISPECLFRVVDFNFLRHFEYRGRVQFQKELLLEMVRRNRCLESLEVCVDGYRITESLANVKKEIREISPRILNVWLWEGLGWGDLKTKSAVRS